MSHQTRHLAHQRFNLAFFICNSSSGTNHRSLSSLWSWRRNSAASIQSSLSEIGLRRTPICAAFLYAFWEPFIAWEIIAALLLWFRGHLNQPSATWEWLGRRAYAVYIIHPPVLVGISLLLHRWVAPALAKLAVVGALACIATWLLADPLVRLPEVRRVV